MAPATVWVLRGERADRVPNFELLIEDQHVEKLLGRRAGNTLGVGGDPAKGSAAGEGARPMYPTDYIELCRRIGQDAIVLGDFWTPIKQRTPEGAVTLLNDRSFKSRADLQRVIWPDDADLEKTLGYVREYVAAARGTNIAVVFCGACIWQTLYEFVIGLEDSAANGETNDLTTRQTYNEAGEELTRTDVYGHVTYKTYGRYGEPLEFGRIAAFRAGEVEGGAGDCGQAAQKHTVVR